MSCGWEGNLRSRVALATCQTSVVGRAQGLSTGDGYPINTPRGLGCFSDFRMHAESEWVEQLRDNNDNKVRR